MFIDILSFTFHHYEKEKLSIRYIMNIGHDNAHNFNDINNILIPKNTQFINITSYGNSRD
ncbi:hypothetical protein C0J52_18925 [Blattella germanica]|nr:hypothetical protein C0J52_18925 [Blattella germanica]